MRLLSLKQGQKNLYFLILLSISVIGANNGAVAAIKYTPSTVFSKVSYANELARQIVQKLNIPINDTRCTIDKNIQPMHVYELHVSTLHELYRYTKANGISPPPLVSSSPMKYEPEDVYYLSELVANKLEMIYEDTVGYNSVSQVSASNKTPHDVYVAVCHLNHALHTLNGKPKISPTEVYSQSIRIKNDVVALVRTISKRLAQEEQTTKRLLITSVYGGHIDGSVISEAAEDKKPKDVFSMTHEIRKHINELKKKYALKTFPIENIVKAEEIRPVDVFLQTQFIIAELNLLKIPQKVTQVTGLPQKFDNKTPSDVYRELSHVSYMLQRLNTVIEE